MRDVVLRRRPAQCLQTFSCSQNLHAQPESGSPGHGQNQSQSQMLCARILILLFYESTCTIRRGTRQNFRETARSHSRTSPKYLTHLNLYLLGFKNSPSTRILMWCSCLNSSETNSVIRVPRESGCKTLDSLIAGDVELASWTLDGLCVSVWSRQNCRRSPIRPGTGSPSHTPRTRNQGSLRIASPQISVPASPLAQPPREAASARNGTGAAGFRA